MDGQVEGVGEGKGHQGRERDGERGNNRKGERTSSLHLQHTPIPHPSLPLSLSLSLRFDPGSRLYPNPQSYTPPFSYCVCLYI